MFFIQKTNQLKFIDGKEIRGLSYINNVVNEMQLSYIKKCRLRSLKCKQHANNPLVTVSLTSFPARIDAAVYSIKSIFHQTMLPDEIILWLAEEQFGGEIPNQLYPLMAYGLQVRFCEDLKSHKKYYYSLKEQDDNLIITIDDDLIYPETLVESLVGEYKRNPNSIICYRGRHIKIHEDGFSPYAEWECAFDEGVKKPSDWVMPSTGAGTLYPPNVLDKRVFDIDMIKGVAYTADDIWMRYMSLLKGTKVVKTHRNCRHLSDIKIKNNIKLADVNVDGGRNDECLRLLDEIFPEVRKNLWRSYINNDVF